MKKLDVSRIRIGHLRCSTVGRPTTAFLRGIYKVYEPVVNLKPKNLDGVVSAWLFPFCDMRCSLKIKNNYKTIILARHGRDARLDGK
jgi:hypothetical protein